MEEEARAIANESRVRRAERAAVILGLIDVLIERGVVTDVEVLEATNARLPKLLEQTAETIDAELRGVDEWPRRWGASD